jgi:serine/threonine protein phosphatase PrpC
MIKLKSAALTQMGAKHQQNDDSVLLDEQEAIYIICDGVSEGGQGKLASELITKIIQEKLIQANFEFNKRSTELVGTKRLHAMQEVMQNTFAEAQSTLSKLAQNNSQYKVAATTCIALWFNGRFAILGHIGDSRAYLFRAGKLYQLTRDHSGLDELLKMGMPMEVAIKNPLARTLTRAFGNAQFNQPDLLKIEFEPNDALFLCTDGVYSALNTTQAMTSFVHDLIQEKPLSSWIDQCSKTSGDDSTLIQIHFKEIDEINLAGIQASDRIHLVQKTPLSKYLDYVQQSHVAAICEIKNVKAGEVVIQEGADGDCMYIIANGSLGIESKGKKLKEFGAGEFFGEIALVQKSKRTATAIAKKDTVLLSLSRQDLEEVFKKDPLIETRFYKAMLETVLSRVVDLSAQIVNAGIK